MWNKYTAKSDRIMNIHNYIITQLRYSQNATHGLKYTPNQGKRNTCIFDIFPTWTCQSILTRQLYFIYSMKSLFFVLIDCQYELS